MHWIALVADIGGTNFRVALGDQYGNLHQIQRSRNVDVSDPMDALIRYSQSASPVSCAVLALAGPKKGDEIQLTNHSWKFSETSLREALNIDRLVILNDFEAATLGAASLAPEDFSVVQSGEADGRNLLVCGPGTGFGAAALIDRQDGPLVLTGEAGHAILGAANEREADLLRQFQLNRLVSIDDVLSARGLEELFRLLNMRSRSSGDIIASAAEQDMSSRRAITLFLQFFGRVLGDLVLIYGAREVIISGGIGRALIPWYAEPSFLLSFRDHPPFEQRMERTPIRATKSSRLGLRGALEVARNRFHSRTIREAPQDIPA